MFSGKIMKYFGAVAKWLTLRSAKPPSWVRFPSAPPTKFICSLNNLYLLTKAVKLSKSYRSVLFMLKLVPAGGNYDQIKKYILENNLDTSHFTGSIWNKGIKRSVRPRIPLSKILVNNSFFQSHKLRLRLIQAKLKPNFCEQCKWAKKTSEGKVPLELDHINGDKRDNRLENLRILCPNCHSLTPTYRGRNKRKSPDGGTGIHASLKMM
jgi:Zn finger protein HypA/HybF involved in hydrogenase expression